MYDQAAKKQTVLYFPKRAAWHERRGNEEYDANSIQIN